MKTTKQHPRRSKRRPPRRITAVDQEAMRLLYGPPKSRDQDDDDVKPVNTDWLPCGGIEEERIGVKDA